MAYSKEDTQKLGEELVDLIHGFANGVGADDMANAMEAMSAGMGASDELKSDTNAAVFDILAGAASAQADRVRDDLVATRSLKSGTSLRLMSSSGRPSNINW